MNDYIKSLRKLVGHMPILLCGASVIVENDKGEMLLQLRRDNNCWGYAGGSVEIGETVEDAAKRELFEETGLVANSLELFNVFSGKELHYVYPNGDEVAIIDIVYICKDYKGEPRADLVESDEIRFFAIDKLPENISPPCVAVIQRYLERRAECDEIEPA